MDTHLEKELANKLEEVVIGDGETCQLVDDGFEVLTIINEEPGGLEAVVEAIGDDGFG